MSAGLKNIGEQQKKEILAEMDSHLRERIEELRAEGEPYPVERAISAVGDPAYLAAEFVAEARISSSIRTYAPWTLLAVTAHIAQTGTKRLVIFLMGLAGYGLTVAGLAGAMLKPFIPGMGLWVWKWGLVWGIPPDGASAHELLGGHFNEASIALAFVFGSTTTLALRRLISRVPVFGKWRMM